MLRLGTVPYLNARPLVQGVSEAPGVQLVQAVPSELAARLRRGELDFALVSAIEVFRRPALSWLEGPAITSEGPVRSILLYLRKPLDRVRTLALDSSSLSAACLTQVCLQSLLVLPAPVVCTADPQAALESIDADAILRIGDPALCTHPGNRRVVDLGALWTEHTGLPCVYALWLARAGTAPGRVRTLLQDARRRGLAGRDELAREFAARSGLDESACVDYLRHAIGYDLGEREREGLALFGRLAHELGLVDSPELPDALA